MMRRMSKRFAARAARASSSSVAPVGAISLEVRNGCSWSAMESSLDEQQVEYGHQPERAEAQHLRRAEPRLVAGDRVVLLLLALEAPDEPAQLLLGLRLRHERHADEHYGVGDEGDHGLPPGRRDRRAEIEVPLRVEEVRDERPEEAGDHAQRTSQR